eukprot:GHVS01006437.1.p1 GENE.GHVS01006437.1~~GHVS01006437.1.p1  ORF type:complete len:226 (+),score=36.81 GHVS01006437.1:164-841(+)
MEGLKMACIFLFVVLGVCEAAQQPLHLCYQYYTSLGEVLGQVEGVCKCEHAECKEEEEDRILEDIEDIMLKFFSVKDTFVGLPKSFQGEKACLVFAQKATGCDFKDAPSSRRLRAMSKRPEETSGENEEETISNEGGERRLNEEEKVLSDDKKEDGNNTVEKLLDLPLRHVLSNPTPFTPAIVELAKLIFQGETETAIEFAPRVLQLFGSLSSQLFGDEGMLMTR